MDAAIFMVFLISLNSLSSAFPEFGLSNLDKSNLDVNYYFKRDCKCVKFKDCKNMVGMAAKASATDRAYLFEKIRKSTCGFIDGQPLVCCPTQPNASDEAYSIEIVEDQPWVWDGDKLFDHYNHNHNHNYNYVKKNKKKIARKINYNLEEVESYEVNLVDFEDPNTKKNCPPIFFDGLEDDIDLSSKHKHFKPYNPHEYNSFDATYGYPPPSGFRFSHLDTTSSSTTTTSTVQPVTGRNEIIDSNQEFPNSGYCGVSVNTRIVGGRNSGPGQFPWIARVGYRNKTSNKLSYRCAGSVISERYVITAAHCVTNLVDDLELSHVRIGEVRGKRRRDCEANPIVCRIPQDYSIERIIAHPNYDSPKYANDIALIRIFKPDGSVPLTPICLPFNNFALLDEELTGRLAIVAGWSSNIAGTTNPPEVTITATSNRKPSLQYVRLPIVNRTQCAVTYAQFSANSWTPIFIQQSQICVQGRENMDACQGDSGGPLMDDGTSDKSFRYTLLGLVSFGPRTCGVSNFPGVYTKVASFIDWIVRNMQP